MVGKNILSSLAKSYVKTVTFDGTTGAGAVGNITIATVVGRVVLTHLYCYCKTSVVTTAAGELELGVVGNTAGLIAQVADAGDIVANDFWIDATPAEVGTATCVVDKAVASDILLKVTTSPMTAGVLEFAMLWYPMSVDGNLG